VFQFVSWIAANDTPFSSTLSQFSTCSNQTMVHFGKFFEVPRPSLDRVSSPLELCGESAYCFALIPNFFSYLIAFGVFAGQLFVLWLVFADSWDGEYFGKPDDSSASSGGYFAMLIILILSVMSPALRGFQLILNCRGVAATIIGLANVIVAASTVIAGFVSARMSLSNTAMVTNAVVVVFVEHLDEEVFLVLQGWCPIWYQKQKNRLRKRYLEDRESEFPKYQDHQNTSRFEGEIAIDKTSCEI
jgi:hypothetical protein